MKVFRTLFATMLAVIMFSMNAAAAEKDTAHFILIGDSRTEGMSESVGNTSLYDTEEGTVTILNHWSYESGKGFRHMVDVSYPFIDRTVAEILEEDPEARIFMICMYGVNDTHNVKKYADLINMKAAQLTGNGVKTYFVSLNPIADEKSNYKFDKDKYVTTFNETIRPLLSEDVGYIDTYSQIEDRFRNYTNDGVHYKPALYREIYGIIAGSVLNQ